MPLRVVMDATVAADSPSSAEVAAYIDAEHSSGGRPAYIFQSVWGPPPLLKIVL